MQLTRLLYFILPSHHRAVVPKWGKWLLLEKMSKKHALADSTFSANMKSVDNCVKRNVENVKKVNTHEYHETLELDNAFFNK